MKRGAVNTTSTRSIYFTPWERRPKIQRLPVGKCNWWYWSQVRKKSQGKAPYFDEPFHVGFNVRGFELCLDPSSEKMAIGNNVHAYWGVQNISEALVHALEIGATKNSDVQEVGGGIKVAKICDPFGNISGLIENAGFKIES